MKKYVVYLIVTLITGLVGCEKEPFFNQIENRSEANLEYYLNSRKTAPVYDGVTKVGNMIRFEDYGTFEKSFKLMDTEDALINDRFIDEWGHLPEDKLVEKEVEVGFHEDLAMEYFEDNFGHQSLRKKIDQLEQTWLSLPELNPETDPNNHIINDRIIRTFVNEDSELMIGESIFKIMQSGVVYEIKDGDRKTADQITDAYATVPFIANNVIVHNSELIDQGKSLFGSCRPIAGDRTIWDYYNGGSRKYRGYLGIRNFIFYSGVLSTTTSYRRINGKWRKRRASLRTSNFGHYTVGSSDCTGNKLNYDSKEKSRYRRHIEKRYVLYFGQPNFSTIARIQSGWLHSNHYCNGNEIDFTLIW